MDNYQIADELALLAKLMDVHGENSFKSKSYAAAAFSVERLEQQLTEMPREKIAGHRGIGSSSAAKIIELLDTGNIVALQNLITATPPGVLEMMNIKGIGPKKIHAIWKEMGIETLGELLYACEENRLKTYKGFGEKTQESIKEAIQYFFNNKGFHLYASIIDSAKEIESILKKTFGEKVVALTGNVKRQLAVIETIDFVVQGDQKYIIELIAQALPLFKFKENIDDYILYELPSNVIVKIYPAMNDEFIAKLIRTSSSEKFNDYLQENAKEKTSISFIEEADFFKANELPFIISPRRENPEIIQIANDKKLKPAIEFSDITAAIHNHSTYSDGTNSLEEMAKACIDAGWQFLVISDHSKSAFYASGMFEDKILRQHKEIDILNEKLKPFRIFKSVESDILNDGSLDYDDDILSSFDLVIASIHSNLKMTEEKAMERLITAIENPYTTILGHLTGRLLLSRKGYPVDHKKIIDACAANNVAIEINANPLRLDIDWEYVNYALEKDVMISINPDAHSIEGLMDVKHGTTIAQKTLLTPSQNLSSLSLADFEEYLMETRKYKGLA